MIPLEQAKKNLNDAQDYVNKLRCEQKDAQTYVNKLRHELKDLEVDKFKGLKKAYSEGAILEYLLPDFNQWVEAEPEWYKDTKYRIKGDISISSWNVHQDIIKKYWNGAEIEYFVSISWYMVAEEPKWFAYREYRVKPKVKEMTLSEISDELGYEVKVIKDIK